MCVPHFVYPCIHPSVDAWLVSTPSASVSVPECLLGSCFQLFGVAPREELLDHTVTLRSSDSGDKESACNTGDPGKIQEGPLEKEMATNSSILA